jgi:hypothetical protein
VTTKPTDEELELYRQYYRASKVLQGYIPNRTAYWATRSTKKQYGLKAKQLEEKYGVSTLQQLLGSKQT